MRANQADNLVDVGVEVSLDHDVPAYQQLPHVVKYSGGRSSAMMLISLLKRGLLDAKRGDVVVFNNTSAEHPATYAFTRQCKEYTERNFGVPFYWVEFATVEEASNGDWTRIPTYRLVNTEPETSDNPNGYHWQGEVFEEMVSHQSFLPGRQSRICTSHLKVNTTNRFLREWFAAKRETVHMGHYKQKSQVSSDSIVTRHKNARGTSEPDIILRKKKFVRARPLARESQKYAEFSNIGSKHILNSPLLEHTLGDFAPMKGDGSVSFISLIGLRADEPNRVERVKSRNELAVNDATRRKLEMSDGEIVMTPLADANISKENVLAFWRAQPWQLRLPEDGELSNCVFCFMKGSRAIPRIRDKIKAVDELLPEDLRSVANTPSDIQWWIDLEEKYERVAQRRNSEGSDGVTIGFWGVDAKESYRSLRRIAAENVVALDGVNAQPCDCTD